MQLCHEHGHIVLTRARFCPFCGRPLRVVENQVEAALSLAAQDAGTRRDGDAEKKTHVLPGLIGSFPASPRPRVPASHPEAFPRSLF